MPVARVSEPVGIAKSKLLGPVLKVTPAKLTVSPPPAASVTIMFRSNSVPVMTRWVPSPLRGSYGSMPAKVTPLKLPASSAAAGWYATRLIDPTANPSSPPVPPLTVPLTLPEMMNASLVLFCPVRFSKLSKTVSSTVPALAPVTSHRVWSKLGTGPVRVSLALLPTTLVMRENGTVSPVAAPVSRLTLTAAPRFE